MANDRFVFDTSYLRMKNITLSYSLPKAWINKLYLSNASLFVTATNLFTITQWLDLIRKLLLLALQVWELTTTLIR